MILRMGAKGRNGVQLDENSKALPMHSRAIEQRTEVVKGRVYIHPMPQLLDNIGYLIVCLPPSSSRLKQSSSSSLSILAILVDCGDAVSVKDQLELIRDVHYSKYKSMDLKLVLSTHKHHDHTAGNRALTKDDTISSTLTDIVGGAVENVPYCTKLVTDGEILTLPKDGANDMNDLVEIECIALPSHTRGSITYVLRNKVHSDMSFQMNSTSNMSISHLFTGDTMFSGGGGVPFESDFETSKDKSVDDKTVMSRFKPTGGSLSIERCFAELLRRAVTEDDAIKSNDGLAIPQMVVYPGHEYTIELLQRQMQPSNLAVNSQWNKHLPGVFFELASQYFIAGHRRDLPKSTRLLTVPSTMKKELKINPYFRSLRKRGQLVITAVTVWYKYLHDEKKSQMAKFTGSRVDMEYLSMPKTFSKDEAMIQQSQSGNSEKTPSSENTWNMNQDDFNKSIFTTVYTEDLESIVQGLRNGRLIPSVAAKKLARLSKKLDEPVVHRRPIPNTLPSEKKMYMGVLGLAVLGSSPCGLCASDSKTMNLPSPVVNTDHLLISKRKLISSLYRLGLLPSDPKSNGIDEVVLIINLLWDESRSQKDDNTSESADFEVGGNEEDDLIELGELKLILYAVAYKQPSWFKRYCMPCGSTPATVLTSKMKRSGGELVKHDVSQCQLCSSVLGCPKHDINEDDDDLSMDDSVDVDDFDAFGLDPQAAHQVSPRDSTYVKGRREI